MSNQKEFVFATVMSYLQEKGIEYNPEVSVDLSKEQRKDVEMLLVAGVEMGTLPIRPGAKALNDVPKYCKGLLDNWLRKDTRLTGGNEYVTKRPGSRAHVGDPKMKAMKQLKSLLLAQGQDVSEVEAAIEAHQAELDKKKQPEVDVEALPEYLRHLVG